MKRFHLSEVLALFAFWMIPFFACANDQITFDVVVIHATKDSGGVDKSLKSLETALVRSFGDYSAFKKLDTTEFNLASGKKHSVKLPNGHDNATFIYNGNHGKKHLVKLSIPKARVEADLRMPINKPFFQAGLRYQGGILILAFRLRE